MTRAVAAVVTLAFVLAGCSGFVQPENPETVTPAPVPTDGVGYPPGVSDDAVVPSTLASAHTRTLATTNYTLVTRQRVTDGNGTVLRRSNHMRYVAANKTTYAGQFRQNGTELNAFTTRIDYWTNGSIVAARYDERANRRNRVTWPVRDDGPVSDLSERRTIRGVGEAVDLSVADRRDSGVVLVGTRFRNPDRLNTPLFVSDPRNVSVRLRVNHDGTVSAFRLAFDAERSDRQVRVTQEMRLRHVGSTTVKQPEWVANTTQRSLQDYSPPAENNQALSSAGRTRREASI
ncbi:hypothetical protein [Haloarcula japonica]|uniref:Lipoprotein n=1 Tax=Haloarcula japonica (strain ATCC 49778 / DSM 6131 / JCM 7785 / NBRC 101032 / NCIMB 13157 / TR-1) TaxID=1227453 RepID=M0L9R9_HALJT|nr:hypothetical protein [Haloarcula japonica]EMA28680.1 hypothetical protein C444_14978 [Haloarcula japonica DSM 6131]